MVNKPIGMRLLCTILVSICSLGFAACSTPTSFQLTSTAQAPTLAAQSTLDEATRVAERVTQTAFAPTGEALDVLCGKANKQAAGGKAIGANSKFYIHSVLPELDFKKVEVGMGARPGKEFNTALNSPSHGFSVVDSIEQSTILLCLGYKTVIVEVCNYKNPTGGAIWSIARYREDLKVTLIDSSSRDVLGSTTIRAGSPAECPQTRKQTELIGTLSEIGGEPVSTDALVNYLKGIS